MTGMPKIIGVFKEIRDYEEVVAETPDFVTIEGGSNVFGTDSFDAKIYLTNQRILFLIAKIMDWKKLNKEAQSFWESLLYGQPKKSSTAMVMTWMDLPLEAVKKVETPSGLLSVKKSQLVIEFDIKKGFWKFFRTNPKIIIHLDNRDIWRTQIEFHRRKLVGESVISKVEISEPPEIKSKKHKVIKKVDSKTKFCDNCGAKTKGKFCPKCGKRI